MLSTSDPPFSCSAPSLVRRWPWEMFGGGNPVPIAAPHSSDEGGCSPAGFVPRSWWARSRHCSFFHQRFFGGGVLSPGQSVVLAPSPFPAADCCATPKPHRILLRCCLSVQASAVIATRALYSWNWEDKGSVQS